MALSLYTRKDLHLNYFYSSDTVMIHYDFFKSIEKIIMVEPKWLAKKLNKKIKN